MAAGDISKKLAHKVRDILGDLGKSRIKNDVIIFDLLSRYQREWMTSFNTTKSKITITLTTALEYSIDVAPLSTTLLVNRVIRIYGPAAQTTEYYYTFDNTNRKLGITDDQLPITGELVYIDAYMKPATDITKLLDPVIGSDFEPYLIDAVLTHFPDKSIPQTLEPIENVRERVKRQANQTRNAQRFAPGNINQLNYS